MSFIWKDDFFFFAKSASSVNRSQNHLAKLKRIEPVELFSASYQGVYAKFVSMMSPKCSIIENDGELLLMALHTHFLPQQQYSRVYALVLGFHALVYRWWWWWPRWPNDQNELHLKRWFFFFLLIADPFSEAKLKHIHNHIRWTDRRIKLIGIFYKSIAGPLPSVAEAYTQPYSFGGRLKLIICQIWHELSVTIHEISTNW